MTKRKPSASGVKDPHAKREANKYENPIPSREFILAHLDKVGVPQHQWEVAAALNLTSDDQLEALRRRMRAMERDGQVICLRRGAYAPVDKVDLVVGRILGHRDGFGFMVPDDSSSDLFLSPGQMKGVFDGDRVLARVRGVDRKGRREGVIAEVIERNTSEVVGRLQSGPGSYVVMPDNKRITNTILVNEDDLHGATTGQFVVVSITEQPTFRAPARGAIKEVMGEHMAPGMEIDVAIRAHGIPNEWPHTVLKEIKAFSKEVPEKAKETRVDLRDTPLVTIDGEDARDFDDAVYCEKMRGGGWRLLVAIADVSHYVLPHSALDQEAVHRGTSVYFPERVIPMLPEVLSNGLCSLNPHVDRLCMVCEMRVSAAGRLSRYKFYEGVMNSKARLTYTQVGAMLEGKKAEKASFDSDYPGIRPCLEELHDLYHVLRVSREQRGAIDFDTTETRIVFGENRKIEKIVPVHRNDAHKIIEECMLCANVAAARFLEKHALPGLFRVHEVPNEEKVTKLREFLNSMGRSLEGKTKPAPGDYQSLLSDLKGSAEQDLVQTVMLRSMKQAIYSPENKGHFGLAYSSYAHFTSPIRRYPDLLLHRALRYLIRSRVESSHVERVKGAGRLAKAEHLPYGDKEMVELGVVLSDSERRADAATRDVDDWLKCEFMLDRVGDTYEGIICAVTGFGFFVRLNGVYVEGLVHISNLENDYYHFNATTHSLDGEHSGRRFRLADAVTVRVAGVNLDDRKIDFELEESTPGKRSSKKGKKGPARHAGQVNGARKTERSIKSGAKSGAAKKRRRSKKAVLDHPPVDKATTKKDVSKKASSTRKPAKKNATKNSPSKKTTAKKPVTKTAVTKKSPSRKAPDGAPKAGPGNKKKKKPAGKSRAGSQKSQSVKKVTGK
ncbi:MAG: ribonuclease R [Gammaproteobacteria bacterium]|nr:ribonuclease R [Gammaproteobacteria bacterium]